MTVLHKSGDKSKTCTKNCMLFKIRFFTNSLLSTVKRAGIHRHCHQHCIHTVFFYTPLSPCTKAVTEEVLTESVMWSVVAGVEWGLLWAQGQMERESSHLCCPAFPHSKSPSLWIGFPCSTLWLHLFSSTGQALKKDSLYEGGMFVWTCEPDQFSGDTHAEECSLLSESRREAWNLDLLHLVQ